MSFFLGICLLQAACAGRSFSGALSQSPLKSQEQVVLNYTLSHPAAYGVVNNWWVGGDIDAADVVLNFYVDGEAKASVVVSVPQSCGAGFGAPNNTYSSVLFSKLAKTSGWSNKLPVPFQQSVVVTFQGADNHVIWLWVRGTEDTPVPLLGDNTPRARLQLQKVQGTFQPQTFVDLAAVPEGFAGRLAATVLSLTSSNLNVLEGCYYLFPDAKANWTSGMELLATGTEDYFESAFYFNAGLVASPFAGVTFKDTNGAKPQVNRVSMYKIHGENDPVVFDDGFKLTWRVGDQTNSQGLKCTCFPGGSTGCKPNGTPQVTSINSYAYVYTWKA
mmetsp:Transcript_43523/g.85205  ORF Transcript_43523/g.85205 Transcript_43523/m.85205 type:complete len:331 (-) Transcript_43523:81-1073(-)|eukprot:CAMPEP_0175119892 /NCGR_PEP_ID=MMETSP0087-20121206/321_1 /TAXON_ID=136419 /ORGANISM="Unknown Unknown, Strain D1" /LENGTH=330 /DNA_ID=CAMNT_0016401285 /DNA_START=33 /DNA_END=1022 /DNA_ORIENTATION=+